MDYSTKFYPESFHPPPPRSTCLFIGKYNGNDNVNDSDDGGEELDNRDLTIRQRRRP